MNVTKRFFIRVYQKILYFFTLFIKIKEPEVLIGHEAIVNLPTLLEQLKKNKALLVTDATISRLGLADPLMTSFVLKRFPFALFNDVEANPKIRTIEEGLKLYIEEECDCVIAIGGGSVLDCAKGIAARSSNPSMSVRDMHGLLKLRHKLPLLIAIPTTAGTGSEATLAAVVTDEEHQEKYSLNDPKLIPDYAILDFTLLEKLPSHLMATTGMDALTHAVEAYIGKANTRKTKKFAVSAVKLVFENIEKASLPGENSAPYRSNMQVAAYQAGVAFTRAYVGSVHALAHALGAFYNVPHGYTNAIILPIVLKKYGTSAEKALAELADVVSCPQMNSDAEKASWFIEEIESLNSRLGIVNQFSTIIKDDDIPKLARHAYKESIPLYPTPKLFTKKELEELYHKIRAS
ncbi:MAG TPA: iron-containing alcohol dehydrogenase [Bacilli bacterium]|nr:iron-containing alcohol dehydrogenase [Bacilli bacterium]